MSPAPDVVGLPELGLRWGVSRQRAALISRRPGFPAPRQLAMGRVWSEADIKEWEQAERDAGRAIPGDRPRRD